MTSRSILLSTIGLGLAAWVALQPKARAQDTSAQKAGTFEKIKVHGASLEGNLEGDPAERDVYVFLPPSYASQPNKRYPVLYFLHGYGATALAYWNLMTVPDAASKVMNAGTVQEMIVVLPDAHTIYDGSMYSNSPTTGNWETYITHDLVSYIDSHYRTIARPEARGLAGHSMGGYGTWRLAMKHPGIYSSIYAMSSCCLMNNPGAPRTPARNANAAPPANNAAAGRGGRGGAGGRGGRGGRGGGFANLPNAEAAAWSPDPMNPPKFFDVPVENGEVHADIAAKWIANSPLAFLDQYVESLKGYKAIMMDVGLQDNLATSNEQLDAALTRVGVTHGFETYEGNHGNRVKERFETKVLPFFSQHLQGEGSK